MQKTWDESNFLTNSSADLNALLLGCNQRTLGQVMRPVGTLYSRVLTFNIPAVSMILRFDLSEMVPHW